MLAFAGPTIIVLVGVASLPDDAGKIKAPEKRVSALIDTGAYSSCIDEKLAKSLKLPVIDRQTVGGVGGRKMHNVYLAHVLVPEIHRQSTGRFIGVKLGSTQPVILGRDFLLGVVFVYDGGSGQITICS